jgi:endoglucanase
VEIVRRRRLAWVAAGGVCVALVASLLPGVNPQVVRTIDGPVSERDLGALPGPGTTIPSSDRRTPTGAAAQASGAAQAPSSSPAQTRPPVAKGPVVHREAQPALRTAPVGLKAPLRTAGNRIVDAGGQPVVLRGIQRVAMQIPGKWPAITDREIAHAQEWGANVIRLPLGEAYIDPQCSNQYVADYFDTLDSVVQSITSRGMVALLDLAFVTRTPCGESWRWRMADTGSIAFWRTMADRYKSNALVAFDLYNEPFDITDDQWRSGGQVADWTITGSVRWTAVGMQTLYDTVRSTGATNLVMISGNGYASDPSPIVNGNGVGGFNIVYAAHAYTCPKPETAQWCTANPNNAHVHMDPAWVDLATRTPVMITEFGWPNANEGAYNASVIGFAQSQSPVLGWIAYAWDGTTKGAYGLVANLNSYAPTPSGAPVKAALQTPP